MPYAIEFPIGQRDCSLPPNPYRALHRNLLQWIRRADPDVATAIHDRPVRKPFTISALEQDHKRNLYWRIALLEDDLWEPLWSGVQASGELELDRTTWPVRWPDARITHRSYDFLVTRVQPSERITMAFHSPTAFRAGNLDSPLPEPYAVFHSWLSRWNDFAPAHRRMSTELLEVARSTVAISSHRIQTRWHDMGHSRIVGFVGQVTYAIVGARRLDQALVWQLNALADYAEFCGTGRKTTFGMGQTRRIHRGQ